MGIRGIRNDHRTASLQDPTKEPQQVRHKATARPLRETPP